MLMHLFYSAVLSGCRGLTDGEFDKLQQHVMSLSVADAPRPVADLITGATLKLIDEADAAYFDLPDPTTRPVYNDPYWTFIQSGGVYFVKTTFDMNSAASDVITVIVKLRIASYVDTT